LFVFATLAGTGSRFARRFVTSRWGRR
jgi:hypothetical protein